MVISAHTMIASIPASTIYMAYIPFHENRSGELWNIHSYGGLMTCPQKDWCLFRTQAELAIYYIASYEDSVKDT